MFYSILAVLFLIKIKHIVLSFQKKITGPFSKEKLTHHQLLKSYATVSDVRYMQVQFPEGGKANSAVIETVCTNRCANIGEGITLALTKSLNKENPGA